MTAEEMKAAALKVVRDHQEVAQKWFDSPEGDLTRAARKLALAHVVTCKQLAAKIELINCSGEQHATETL